MRIKIVSFIAAFIITTSCINPSGVTDGKSQFDNIQIFYALSAGLMTTSPLLTSTSFIFFGLADLCDIEYDYISRYNVNYDKLWNPHTFTASLTADDYKRLSLTGNMIGGFFLGAGGLLGLTSAGFLIAASILEDLAVKKNRDRYGKLKFPPMESAADLCDFLLCSVNRLAGSNGPRNCRIIRSAQRFILLRG